MNGTVYVCSLKDIVCGDRIDNWCPGCPKRGLQVAVAPNAAAGPYPTLMRPATPQDMVGYVRLGAVCWHDKATKTMGPTTDQINWWCRECGAMRTTHPTDAARAAALAKSADSRDLLRAATYLEADEDEDNSMAVTEAERIAATLRRLAGDALP